MNRMTARPLDQPAKFIIWAPSFRETSGGIILLHLLCERLNEAGETALIWPARRPKVRLPTSPRAIWRALRYIIRREDMRFSRGPFKNRLAYWKDVGDSIIVYPEIVSGNPLRGRHVVRWLLHRPGNRTGVVDYGSDEMYFHVVDAFRDDNYPSDGNRLNLKWFNGVYENKSYTTRSGTCYAMRKGAGRSLVHDTRNSTLIDNLSHEEISEEFNRRERFYSYDPYTHYSTYAVACGCISIVVPEPGKSKVDWQPREEDRYGLAYGEEDIPWAIETRQKLLDRLWNNRQAEDEMVRAFIQKCKAWARRHD